MGVKDEAVFLLLDDLMDNLTSEHPNVSAAIRRISLFRTMYEKDENPMTGNTQKKVLILQSDDEFFVCDEYYPNDYGRVHILFPDGSSSYGIFDRDSYTLDWHKTSVEIRSVFFKADNWPEDIRPGYNSIASYFGIHLK